MDRGDETSLFATRKLLSLFALIDAKLTDSKKRNVYHGEKSKRSRLIQDRNFFFLRFLWKPVYRTKRWRKESWCIFHYYLSCDSRRPVFNTKYHQRIAETCSKHSRTSTMKLFCEKAPLLMFEWAINTSLNWFLMTKLFY